MSSVLALTPVKKISIEVVSGPLRGQVFSFEKPVILIGRGSENDLVLEKDSRASRVHLEIRQNSEGISVNNVTEKNPAFLNGQVVKIANLASGNRVQIGETQFVVYVDQPIKTNPGVAKLAVVKNAPPSLPPPPKRKIIIRPENEQPKFVIYILVGILILIGAYLISSGVKKRKLQQIRTTDQVEKDIEVSNQSEEESKKKLENIKIDAGGDEQYQLAQQQFTKGFRDYRMGQYTRALQSLRAAVAFYPNHEAARKYLTLTQKKLDEQIRTEIDLGLKYRGQGNYRLCKAAFVKAERMVLDSSDSVLKEIVQYKNECDSRLRE